MQALKTSGAGGEFARTLNNTVRANELSGHLHVPTGLVDEGEVEGDLPGQIHLIVRHTLQEEEVGRGVDKRREKVCEATLL